MIGFSRKSNTSTGQGFVDLPICRSGVKIIFLGWMEWDLVRSGRLVIDAGMHDSGWTRQEATDCWKMNLPLQSDIAEREVDRVLDWPAQAISYKIGELTILELKKRMQSAKKDEFCIKDFHSLLLKNGSVPLSVLTN